MFFGTGFVLACQAQTQAMLGQIRS